jgi:glycosyltransferase involved in cell wall biosynthesis
MKSVIFFHDYKPLHETKDPGQIPIGLNEIGINASLITLKKKELLNYNSPFSLIQIQSLNEIGNAVQSFDTVIVYSWLDPSFNNLIREIKKRDKKIIVKSDSDGRLGLTTEPKGRSSPYYMKQKPFGRVTLGYIKRIIVPNYQKNEYKKRIEQIEIVDAVVIESPDAASNLSFFLTKHGRPDLIDKIRVIPNPVTPDIINSRIEGKENIVVSIGRWDDIGQKNPEGLVNVLKKFLYLKSNWKAFIIGPGEKVIEVYMKDISTSIRQRINITGPLGHEKIKDYLLKSKIFFMPSRWEGFSIAASEGVCCGCTVVGSPLESLRYLTMQGFSGNVSYSLDVDAMFGALVYEANKWESNEIDYINISNYWREKLNRQSIAKQFAKIIDKIGSR